MEMKKELETLKNNVSFREYLGYELALKHFQKRFNRIINPL